MHGQDRAGGYLFIHHGGPFLITHPVRKVFGAINGDAQKHLGVLRSAVLRALPDENSRVLEIQPHPVWVVRKGIGG